MRTLLALTLLVSTAFCGAGLANDTMSTLGAGGLIFIETEDVKMASEDLYVSPSAVRVKYQFTNNADHDVETLVALVNQEAERTGDLDAALASDVVRENLPDIIERWQEARSHGLAALVDG